MKRLSDIEFVDRAFIEGVPPEPMSSVCEWGRKNVKLVGSVRSENYDPDITPWAKEPTECTCDGITRIVSFCKPIQSGGSAASEVAVCRRIALKIGGDLQWNWESDEKALDRWDKRIERILKASPPVKALWPAHQTFKAKKCLVAFPHCNLIVQGQHIQDNLDSDSISFQVNEELHNWEPGRLAKADGRLTAVWNGFQMNVSNASYFEDEFHQKFQSGTMEFWEVPCPECGEFWPMRTRWDDERPELGGLRYDADGCRLENGKYDYTKLEGTIRYQFPCKHTIRDNREVRRQMSILGRYGKPTNQGAAVSNRSFTLEAVSVDYIPWMKLIEQKHTSLRAMRLGDPAPWWQYLRERECLFADKSEDRPMMESIQVNATVKKSREGMPGKVARFAALDRQQGSMRKGESQHWWLVIRDVDANGNSLLVWEGKCLTDEDAVFQIKAHSVPPTCVVVDSSDDTPHVYQLCLREGYNAVKCEGVDSFAHKNGSRRIFSPMKPLYRMMPPGNPTRKDRLEEPMFWHCSKGGMYERLHWWRHAKDSTWGLPSDTSEEYRKHLDAVEFVTRQHPRTGEAIIEVVFRRKRYDMAWCEAAITMLVEMAELIGAPAVKETKEYQLKEMGYEK